MGLLLWQFGLLLLLGWTEVRADCNVCSAASSTACVSDTQFQYCVGGFPTGPVNTCPTDFVCTSLAVICQTAPEPAACSGCNKCDTELVFACTSSTTFQLCLGVDKLSPITGTCAPNYVCNVNNKNICSTAVLGSPATCSILDDPTTTSSTTSTTTTASPSTTDPTLFCRTLNQSGRFPYGGTLETTCRQYILCYLLSGAWYGVLYTCPGSTYFDSAARLCSTPVPARCSSGVQTLQLRHLLLD